MTTALGILKGEFGRVALLDLTSSLVAHAHHHCHVVLKASGPDRWFGVRDRTYRIDADTAILVNTWEEHFYDHDPALPQTVFLALYIEPGWLAGIDRCLRSVTHPAFFPATRVEMNARSRALADRLIEMVRHGADAARTDVEAAIFEFMLSLIEDFSDWRSIAAQTPAPPASDHRIRRAIGFMRDNVGEALALDRVAQVACLSRPHFNARFRQCTGLSPAMFANVLRIEHAVASLSRPGRPIGELASALGFTEPANFTRFFHQHVGTSPREFRGALASFDRAAL
jgi:AraC family transcriptional regulator